MKTFIPITQAYNPGPEDSYDMEQVCIEYPESPQCYGSGPKWNSYDILLVLVTIGFLIGALIYENKKLEKERSNRHRNERRRLPRE